MNNKDFEFFKRNLNGYIVELEGDYGIFVLAPKGEYRIIKNNANDTYSVKYIPNLGIKEFSVHFTMSGVIEYIKEGDKYKE